MDSFNIQDVYLLGRSLAVKQKTELSYDYPVIVDFKTNIALPDTSNTSAFKLTTSYPFYISQENWGEIYLYGNEVFNYIFFDNIQGRFFNLHSDKFLYYLHGNLPGGSLYEPRCYLIIQTDSMLRPIKQIRILGDVKTTYSNSKDELDYYLMQAIYKNNVITSYLCKKIPSIDQNTKWTDVIALFQENLSVKDSTITKSDEEKYHYDRYVWELDGINTYIKREKSNINDTSLIIRDDYFLNRIREKH